MSRTFNPRVDGDRVLDVAHAWHRTLGCKARSSSQGARGQRWLYRALHTLLGARIDSALYHGEYESLEKDLAALSGSPMVQAL